MQSKFDDASNFWNENTAILNANLNTPWLMNIIQLKQLVIQ